MNLRRIGGWLRAALVTLLSLPIVLYQRLLSPLKPPTCRFRPTCSTYALQALRMRGPIVGSWLALRRVLRCHPFTEPGEDPVPPAPGHGRSTHRR